MPAETPQSRELLSLLATVEVTLHPYGFYIYRIERGILPVPVRFHVWLVGPRSRQIPDWPPHSHNASMISQVIFGELKNKSWMNPRIGFGQPIYLVGYEHQRQLSTLRQTDIRISLGAPTEQRVTAPNVYHVPKGVFHDTLVKDQDQCVTACRFFDDREGVPLVAGTAWQEANLAFDRRSVTNAARKSSFELLRQVLMESEFSVQRLLGSPP